MTAWIVITEDHLRDYLVAAQLSALQSAALATGQTAPFGRVMPDRAAYVRNRISGRVRISATANAIPPELKTQTALLIIEALSVRISIGLELTEDQKTMIRRAYADLDIAGTEQFPISDADDAIDAPVQPGNPRPLINAKTRRFARENAEGM